MQLVALAYLVLCFHCGGCCPSFFMITPKFSLVVTLFETPLYWEFPRTMHYPISDSSRYVVSLASEVLFFCRKLVFFSIYFFPLSCVACPVNYRCCQHSHKHTPQKQSLLLHFTKFVFVPSRAHLACCYSHLFPAPLPLGLLSPTHLTKSIVSPNDFRLCVAVCSFTKSIFLLVSFPRCLPRFSL